MESEVEDEKVVRITCTICHETEKAVLVDVENDEVWLPKSVVHVDRLSDGTAEISVPVWLATAKGLI